MKPEDFTIQSDYTANYHGKNIEFSTFGTFRTFLVLLVNEIHLE